MGGWVGRWVGCKWVEKEEAVRMSYCNGWVGGWRYLLDACGLELVVNDVEISGLGLPKGDFEVGGRVVALFGEEGGWVGGCVIRKVEKSQAVRMSYWNGWVVVC